jgi:hypothetical protein
MTKCPKAGSKAEGKAAPRPQTQKEEPFPSSQDQEIVKAVQDELSETAVGDRRDVMTWLRSKDVEFIVGEEPIEPFLSQIAEMEDSYGLFPKEAKRTRTIERILRGGGTLEPIYVETDDPVNFILEGRHRIVAFKRVGRSTVPVCRVRKL